MRNEWGIPKRICLTLSFCPLLAKSGFILCQYTVLRKVAPTCFTLIFLGAKITYSSHPVNVFQGFRVRGKVLSWFLGLLVKIP